MRAVVDQRDLEPVADAAPQHRAGRLAAERPQLLASPRGDLAHDLLGPRGSRGGASAAGARAGVASRAAKPAPGSAMRSSASAAPRRPLCRARLLCRGRACASAHRAAPGPRSRASCPSADDRPRGTSRRGRGRRRPRRPCPLAGRRAPEAAPFSTASSWTSLSWLVTSMTSRSPAGTCTAAGLNRMSRARTSTVVVCPSRRRVRQRATRCPRPRGRRRRPPRRPSPARRSRRPRRPAARRPAHRLRERYRASWRRADAPRAGEDEEATSAPSTTNEARTRTALGTGAAKSSEPAVDQHDAQERRRGRARRRCAARWRGRPRGRRAAR